MNNIIQHDTKLQDITFSNILNLDEIQKLQDLFADVHGVASLITDINGNPITKPSKFTRLCDTIIRKTQKGCANCYKSDGIIGKYNPLGANSQPCLSGGLWDAGASITVGGKHIANWLIGQVRTEDTDEQELLKYADEIGVDRSEYKAALNEIPIMSVDKFKKIADLLFVIANELSEKAFNILQLRQQIDASIQNQKALKESEELHRTILQTAMDGYWRIDLDGKFVELNDAYCNMSGYTKTELLNMRITDVEVVENKEITRIHLTKILESGGDRFISKHKRKNGSVYDVEVSALYQPEFKNAVIVFVRDITEQKQAEETLKESERRFKILFDDAPDAMLLADPETSKIIDANNTACRLFKKQKHELIDLLQYELHPPQNEDISKKTFKEQFENTIEKPINETVENNICCSDGTEIPVEIIGQAIHLNGKSLMLGTFRDISERKKAEEALKQSEEKFAVAFKTSPYAITITRPEDGKFIEVNDSFYSMTGYSPEEALNNSSIGMDLWIDAEDRNNVLKVLRVGGAISGQEFQFKKKNGEIITCMFSAQLINIKNNRYILSSINDISERKKAEEELRESEDRFKKLSSFTFEGIIIHDNAIAIDVNQSTINILGYDKAEIIGMNLFTVIHADYHDLVKENIVKQVAPPYQILLIRKDGSTFDAEIQAQNINYQGETFRVACIRDITERKQAEKALKESEERYALVIDASECLILK
jgi:PAS domain S-box-containing protein